MPWVHMTNIRFVSLVNHELIFRKQTAHKNVKRQLIILMLGNFCMETCPILRFDYVAFLLEAISIGNHSFGKYSVQQWPSTQRAYSSHAHPFFFFSFYCYFHYRSTAAITERLGNRLTLPCHIWKSVLKNVKYIVATIAATKYS